MLHLLQARENKEELKSMLKVALRDKSDLFNSENPEEDKVCLVSLVSVHKFSSAAVSVGCSCKFKFVLI